MRYYKVLLAAFGLMCALSAGSASAVTITLKYGSLAGISLGSEIDFAGFANGETAFVEIVINSPLVKNKLTSSGELKSTRFRDSNGTIKLFNTSGNEYVLTDRGVDMKVQNGKVRFTSRKQSQTPQGDVFLAVAANSMFGDNNSVSANIAAGQSFYDTVTALAALNSSGTGVYSLTPLLIAAFDVQGDLEVLATSDENSSVYGVQVSNVPLPAAGWLLLGALGTVAVHRKRSAAVA